METIKKTLFIEPSLGRSNTKMPYLKNSDIIYYDKDYPQFYNWGEIICDVKLVSSSDSKLYNSLTNGSIVYAMRDRLPVITLSDGSKIARFRDLMDGYVLIKKIADSSIYFKLCHEKYIKITDLSWGNITDKIDRLFYDDFIKHGLEFVSVGGTYSGTSEYYCETEYYEEFNNKFSSISEANKFYLFVKNLLDNGIASKFVSIPYIDVPIFIEEETVTVGCFSPYIEEWVPNKTYYSGDCVYYDIDDGNGTNTYVLTTDTYSGNYVKEDRHTYFDTMDADGNYTFEHWAKSYEKENSGGTRLNATAQSELYQFRSHKISYDDSGNTMPFIVKAGYDEENDTYIDKYYFPYLLGPSSVSLTSDGDYIGNYMESIVFYDSDDNVISEYTETTTGFISNEDISDDCYSVEFTYYINCTYILDANGKTIVGTNQDGIKYVEKYYCSKSEDVFIYGNNGTGLTIQYLDIDLNGTIDGYSDGNRIANTEYTDGGINGIDVQHVKLFQEDSTIGIVNVNKNITANITRGKYAAYERHNILGEVNTFQDLENYRNNLFNL